MPSGPKLTKYYIIFAVLIALVVGLAAYTLSTASDSKADKATANKMLEIASKLDQYIASNNQPPATLDDAGVNNVPSSISYSKTTTSQYKLCATYKTAASSNLAGGKSPLILSLVSRIHGGSLPVANNQYFDAYSLALNYKKGQNCQSVKPVTAAGGLPIIGSSGPSDKNLSASASSNTVTAKCGSIFELQDQTTVKSVDTGQGILSLDAVNAKLTDKSDAPITTLPSIKYDSLTTVYKGGCQKGTIDDLNNLKAGSAVTVYLLTDSGSYADQVEL